jgi:hypothetical protein
MMNETRSAKDPDFQWQHGAQDGTPNPFHVAITDRDGVTGVVMVDQVTSIDFQARKVKGIGRASPAVLDEVLSLLAACMYIRVQQKHPSKRRRSGWTFLRFRT